MAFAYSRNLLDSLLKARFSGEWKYLRRALFEIPEEQAERALLELGLYLRVIDDGEERQISSYYDERSRTGGEQVPSFGELIRPDGSRAPLLARDIANMIIHAERYEWNMRADSDPTVICIAGKAQRDRFKWSSASINLVMFAGLCGQLMS